LVQTAEEILGGASHDHVAVAPIAGEELPEAHIGTPRRSSQAAPRRIGRRGLVFGVVGAVLLAGVAVVSMVALGGGTNESASATTTVPTASPTSEPTENTEAVEVATVSPTSEPADAAEAVASDPSREDGAWRPLSFITSDPLLWAVSSDDRLTAVGQTDADAFAWSTETVDGDVAVQFDLESPGIEAGGCVIIYGSGQPFHVQGSLIFCIEWDVFMLEKHTTYHSGENFVTYAPSNLGFSGEVYEVEIEIAGDVASMWVNGGKVLSTVFDPEEIRDRGRIGLHKKAWIAPDVTFSNVEVRTSPDEVQAGPNETEDEFDCELDTGTDLNHFPISSPYIDHTVEIDGAITSPAEWAEAQCVDLRMHYGINVTNPNFHQGRWWIQHDDEAIFFLARIPAELGFDTAFVNYFWPEYVGTWAHSDGISADVEGTVTDNGQWDELQFYDDVEMDPPGTFDTVGAVTEDADFVWIELRHPLDSGDGYDWVFEPGGTYGNNPYDSVVVGVSVDEGTFLRYLQLEIGEP
jgi:hypothetical protein